MTTRWTDVHAEAEEPFVGVTTDGTPVPGLFALAGEGLDPEPIVAAAEVFLRTIPDELGAQVQRPMGSRAWRQWTNAFFPSGAPMHGLCLELVGIAPEALRRRMAHGIRAARVSPVGS